MSYPQFSKDRSTLEQVQNLEQLADEYRRSSGHDISDDILLSTLIRVLPKNVQQHVQVTMKEDSTYAEVREQVVCPRAHFMFMDQRQSSARPWCAPVVQ